MSFNFIEQILAFEEAKATLLAQGTALNSTHIALYMAMLLKANKNGRKAWTTITKVEACREAGISINTYYKCLNDLTSCGLIEVKTNHDKRKPIAFQLVSNLRLAKKGLVSNLIPASIKSDTRLVSNLIPLEKEKRLKKKEEDLFDFEEGKEEQEQPDPENNSEKPKQPKRKSQPAHTPAGRINGRQIL